jgi:putative ABC transport system permease protein
MALILSALGIYGVISYSVAQRTREMGIRIALGARAEDVLRLMMRQAVRLSIIGVITGTLLGLGLTHVMESLLYGVSRTTRLRGHAARVGRRGTRGGGRSRPTATRVDPLVALRCE